MRQINDQTPLNEIIANEHVMDEPHEIPLRRPQRKTRFSISNDYVVYLQESEFD